MPDAPTIAEDHLRVAAWLRSAPRTSGPLDDGALVRVTESLFDIGVTCARAGKAPEYRAALLKSLASIDASVGLDLTEEEVFAASHRLREALYVEMLSYRRAARADLDGGALDG